MVFGFVHKSVLVGGFAAKELGRFEQTEKEQGRADQREGHRGQSPDDGADGEQVQNEAGTGGRQNGFGRLVAGVIIGFLEPGSSRRGLPFLRFCGVHIAL